MIVDHADVNNTVNSLCSGATPCSQSHESKSCQMCLVQLQRSRHGFPAPLRIRCAGIEMDRRLARSSQFRRREWMAATRRPTCRTKRPEKSRSGKSAAPRTRERRPSAAPIARATAGDVKPQRVGANKRPSEPQVRSRRDLPAVGQRIRGDFIASERARREQRKA